MRKLGDLMLWGLVAVTLGVLAFVSTREGSVPHSLFRSYVSSKENARVLAKTWAEIIDGGRLVATVPNAAVIIAFSDYQCPYCRQSEPAVDSLRALGAATFSYHHLPLAAHPASIGAARAAICAEAQGKFESMHRRLMTTVAWQTDSNWRREASHAGVPDSTAFVTCLDSEMASSRVEADLDLARKLGVNGTPTFFSSKRRFDGQLLVSEGQWLVGK